MNGLERIAFIGNSLPRRCGIATFTGDLQRAVLGAHPGLAARIVAMDDHGTHHDYPREVAYRIAQDRIEDYLATADALNADGTQIACLQHEFGIFGGPAGDHVNLLLGRLRMPVVTTLHTVLAEPDTAQRAAMGRVIAASARLVVMAAKGRDLLQDVYGVPPDRIAIIPHGIPDFPFVEPEAAKARLGFAGRRVILTFGLLSPSKGIEVVIDAMPAILRRCPEAVYVVLGATHPNLVRQHGEAYREGLVARATAIGVAGHVVLLDRFVDVPMLLRFISMCDVYVTPYLKAEQMTSGTLAYSHGLGKAVVSTPYWHARELLAGGAGELVPFADAPATGEAIARLLTDDAHRMSLRRRAYAASRDSVWRRVAERYLAVFEDARREQRVHLVKAPALVRAIARAAPLPALRTDHLLLMTDDTGLMQHAVETVPDRSHGYCVDDNARALLLACALNARGEQPLPEPMPARYAAFIQHAWNPDNGRFRNFMGFDRRWLEPAGSEDSHGRTLWALGTAAAADASAVRRRWAALLFARALPATEAFRSPRAWAFTLLGLDALHRAAPLEGEAARLRVLLAGRLAGLLARTETTAWTWFEGGLAYDNARLPQALIVTGATLCDPTHVADGLRSLRWLMAAQTAPSGVFRPVGTAGFGEMRQAPRVFDQQPLEAAATIAACLAAWRAGAGHGWSLSAENAFAWFTGHNDLGVTLVDPETGSCRDGLHADRANENCGAESVLSYLTSLAEMRAMRRGSAALPIAAEAAPALSA